MAGHGFIQAILRPQHIAEIGMELRDIGAAIEGSAKDCFGFLYLAARGEPAGMLVRQRNLVFQPGIRLGDRPLPLLTRRT
ncbi:MAG TPA: hypothetical protein VGJ31_15130 [Dongiaceae bacterium]